MFCIITLFIAIKLITNIVLHKPYFHLYQMMLLTAGIGLVEAIAITSLIIGYIFLSTNL